MKPLIEPGISKPNLSRTEAKNDATTRAAKQIIKGETASRQAKTERLRKARAARDQTA